MKKLDQKVLNQKGFTLIEVLAVIVILALLGIIAVPGVIRTMNSSKKSSYYIMVSDIQTASGELFEELEFQKMGGGEVSLWQYSANGVTSEKVNSFIDEENNQQKIQTNLQTLVSNGFLKGSSNEKKDSNQNSRVLIHPVENKDIGFCEIIISKKVDEKKKVTYLVRNTSEDPLCPTDDDYQK